MRRWVVANADPEAFAKVEFDESVRPGCQRRRDAHPRKRDAALPE
jgi:hypothetical protein